GETRLVTVPKVVVHADVPALQPCDRAGRSDCRGRVEQEQVDRYRLRVANDRILDEIHVTRWGPAADQQDVVGLPQTAARPRGYVGIRLVHNVSVIELDLVEPGTEGLGAGILVENG